MHSSIIIQKIVVIVMLFRITPNATSRAASRYDDRLSAPQGSNILFSAPGPRRVGLSIKSPCGQDSSSPVVQSYLRNRNTSASPVVAIIPASLGLVTSTSAVSKECVRIKGLLLPSTCSRMEDVGVVAWSQGNLSLLF